MHHVQDNTSWLGHGNKPLSLLFFICSSISIAIAAEAISPCRLSLFAAITDGVFVHANISAFLAFGIGVWQIFWNVRCTGGNETGWPRIRMMQPPHGDDTMRVVWFNTLKWDSIALSTCPCYIALDGSSHNACSTRWCTGCTL
jgi:hypothetical protein